MATYYQNLATRLNTIGEELATIQNQPVTRVSDQGSSSKGTLERYRLQLMAEAKAIREELAAAGLQVAEDGTLSGGRAAEVEHYGY